MEYTSKTKNKILFGNFFKNLTNFILYFTKIYQARYSVRCTTMYRYMNTYTIFVSSIYKFWMLSCYIGLYTLLLLCFFFKTTLSLHSLARQLSLLSYRRWYFVQRKKNKMKERKNYTLCVYLQTSFFFFYFVIFLLLLFFINIHFRLFLA